jgi:hypothetical protein
LHRKYTFVYLALLKSNLIGRNREGWFWRLILHVFPNLICVWLAVLKRLLIKY